MREVRQTNAEQLVVDATSGVVPGTPVAWTDGRLSGYVYDFVTWHTDGGCGSGCPASDDYKRLTVEVTLTGASEPSHPALVSTLVADPAAAPSGSVSNGTQNPLASPSTSCQNAQGAQATCSNGLSNGTPATWFFYDTPATATYSPPSGSHPTHPTVAPSGTCSSSSTSGCPVPDLMGSAPPAGSATAHQSPVVELSRATQPAEMTAGQATLCHRPAPHPRRGSGPSSLPAWTIERR